MRRIMQKVNGFIVKAAAATANNRGEGYVDLAVRILISIVLGSLILGALYALFSSTVIPTMIQRIQEMFNYQG
jgi:hypothetical protein